MASVFKRKGGKNWIASWFDHEGERLERSTRTTDKRLAERIAQRWEDEATARRTGLVDVRAEAIAAHESRPLSDHLADFVSYLSAKGTTDQTIAAAEARINLIITHSKAERIGDLTPSVVLAAIQHARIPGKVTPDGISNKTATHYVRAIKSFTRWLVRDKRTATDELAHLAGFNEATDRRRVRRDVEPDELARLIDAATKTPSVIVDRPVRDKVSGERRSVSVRMHYPERVWAYRIAAGTGFRASEVSSLTPESFDLDGENPAIAVEACYSKRKRRDVQPIRQDLADLLRPWLATKPAQAPVCPLPHKKAALLLRADLDVARRGWIAEACTSTERAKREVSDFLRHTDSAGRVVDFHGLRHTFISRVVESGASVKVAQELSRHSTPTLTIGRYAHARLYDLSAALEKLPSTQPARSKHNVMKATGTDGKLANYPPHVGPQMRHESTRDRATQCESAVGGDRGGITRKPLQITGLRGIMRRDATGRESAEGRARTADLRVMNPAL